MKSFQFILIVGLLIESVATRAAEFGWHLRQSPVTNLTLNAVAYGNAQFVAVGEGGTILTSPDGSNWISRVSGTTWTLREATFGLNRFVVVGYREFGYSDNGILLSSPDGINWESYTNSSLKPLFDVAYGNGVFVAVGYGAYTSYDGRDWSDRHPAALLIEKLSFGNGVFVGIYSVNDSAASLLFTSMDGTNWTERSWYEFGRGRAVAFGAGRFVAVGGLGHPRYYAMTTSVSTNGVDWSAEKVIGNNTYLHNIIYDGDRFFALGANFTIGDVGKYATSTDGISWQNRSFPPTPALRDVAFGVDTYVVVGNKGTILQSEPLTPPPPPPMEPPRLGITYTFPLRLLVQGTAGQRLRLEYLDDFDVSSTNWRTLIEDRLSSGSSSLLDTNTPTTRRFYRAVVLP